MTASQEITNPGVSLQMIPAGSETITFASGETIGSDITASGATEGIRIIPINTEPEIPCIIAGETTITLHGLKEAGEGFVPARKKYLRGNNTVNEAMSLLVEYQYTPARITHSPIPVDIFACRGSETLLVQVIYSRTAITDVGKLTKDHATEIDNLRQMGSPVQFRKVVMAYSPPSNWKLYDVLPGGLMPAWSVSEIPKE